MEIAALIFAGVTAMSGGATAYNQYRANHPRRNRTGQIPNYTAAHAGYSMAAPYRPVPQYHHLIQAPAYSVVNYNVNYNQVTYNNPPVRSQSYNYAGPSSQQQHMVPRQSARPAQQPNRSASQRQIQPSQQQRQNARPGQQPSRSASQSQIQPQPTGFGGTISVIAEQSAPDTFEDDDYGLSTGRRPGYTKANAQVHWQSFKRSGYKGEARTVAVLNWTKGEITMFVERDMTYFRNYRVAGSNVALFGQKYRGNEIFSGIVKDGELVGSNHALTIVEDDGECELNSSNCWTELGISGPGVAEPVFVEMVRAAVFGLLCCVHKAPSRMNVDMLYGNGVDFVHVDSDRDYLQNGPDCCFSVFSFLTDGWATDLVLVG